MVFDWNLCLTCTHNGKCIYQTQKEPCDIPYYYDKIEK